MEELQNVLNNDIQCAAALVCAATHAVALTGAGISTPSGIPDFRSRDAGMWELVDPMVVASLSAFLCDPAQFYDWFRPLLTMLLAACPNPAHVALAKLEKLGVLKAIVTQNIDGLHHKAGSQTVHELHGHVRTITCMYCKQVEPAEWVIPQFMATGKVPYHHCGGVMKPSVIFFGEGLPLEMYTASVTALERADLVLAIGSSLEVAPASELPLLALRRGAKLIVINFDSTYLDAQADVVIRADTAVVLPRIVELATS